MKFPSRVRSKSRATELDRTAQSPVLFDALIGEDETACVFVKTLTIDDPGVAQQRTTPRWPHHLPGELVIAPHRAGGCVALCRLGLIEPSWRGHGVRIVDARFSAPVLLGERFFTRVEIVRSRRLLGSLHVRLRYRMWKLAGDGAEIETYRSEQDAIFFPGGRLTPSLIDRRARRATRAPSRRAARARHAALRRCGVRLRGSRRLGSRAPGAYGE